jgi:trimeric autotransporter adhesin
MGAGFFQTSGSNNTAIGNNAQVPINTGSNQVRIGDATVTYAGVQVAWTVTSDRRWKENIQTSPLGLDFIKDVRPVLYHRKGNVKEEKEMGVIAQDLEKVLEKHGFSEEQLGMLSKDDKGFYSVRYNDFIAPLIKAVQEQQKLIEQLQSDNEKLSTVNNDISEQLTSILVRLSNLEKGEVTNLEIRNTEK